MRIPVHIRTVLGCALLLFGLLPVVSPVVLSQAENFLTNPGLNGPYQTLDVENEVAEGWTSWTLGNDTLTFTEAPADRALEGEAQQFGSFLAPHIGGLMQTVQTIEPGSTVEFVANVYKWSTRDTASPDVSVDPAQVFVQVGIDPTGGMDPASEAIVWSAAVEDAFDTYNTYMVSTVAEADSVTVFIRSTATNARLETQLYVDEASLMNVEGSTDGAPESTEEVVVGDTGTEVATEVAEVSTEESSADTGDQPSDTQLTETAVAQKPTDDALIAAATNGAATLQALTLTPADGGTDGDTSGTPSVSIMTTTPEATGEGGSVDLSSAEQTATAIIGAATEQIAALTQTTEALTGTAEATEEPTDEPTTEPTEEPTEEATEAATEAETEEPTVEPTAEATVNPADATATQVVEATGTAEVLSSISVDFPEQVIHTVTYGDNVNNIAIRYGSTINAITVANGLQDNRVILVGQRLIVPVRAGQGQPTTEAPQGPTAVPTQPPNTEAYFVQYGDSLTTIAAKYRTTATTLARLNGITNPNLLLVGQRIYVPTAGAPQPTAVPPTSSTPDSPSSGDIYIVQRGDSLFTIALKFNTTIAQLVELNDIPNPNRILVGQQLVLP